MTTWRRPLLAGAVGIVLAGLLAGCGGADKHDFDKRLDAFELPDAYKPIAHPSRPAVADSQDDYAFRAWDAEPGADICADLEHEFRRWADGKVQADHDLGGVGCEFRTHRDKVTQRAAASPAKSTRVIVEMWNEGYGF